MSYIKNFIDNIEEAITINFENFDATDSREAELEGIVRYQEKEYPVELKAHSEDSYERQAAYQIADAILKEK